MVKAGVMEEGKFHEVTEGTPQGGVISPLLGNIYLHYVFDLWVQSWRKKHAHGEVYAVRYADDLWFGFQYEGDARAMRKALAERLAKFELELHPDKTRVFRFGRFASEQVVAEGRSRPETFDFLGFTHIVAKTRSGAFLLQRRTSRKKRRVKLARIHEQLRARRHQSPKWQHEWLCAVLRGHYAYYAVPTNIRALCTYRRAIENAWLRQLQRRSQRPDSTTRSTSASWRSTRSLTRRSSIHGPTSGSRFATPSVDPRWEPGAGNLLAGFCRGAPRKRGPYRHRPMAEPEGGRPRRNPSQHQSRMMATARQAS
jgi:hypothetical protein